jgi:hypothetical protein
MSTKIEELINQIDPNKEQCSICLQYFNKKEIFKDSHWKCPNCETQYYNYMRVYCKKENAGHIYLK